MSDVRVMGDMRCCGSLAPVSFPAWGWVLVCVFLCVVPCTLCVRTGCGLEGRLSFGASLWSALETCDFRCTFLPRSIPAALVHVCALLHLC